MRFLQSLGGIFALGGGPDSPVYVHIDRAVPRGGDLSRELIRVAEAGVSHIVLSSYVEGNPVYNTNLTYSAGVWGNYSDQARKSVLLRLHDLGTKLSISSGGNLEGDYWRSQTGAVYGKRACKVLQSLGVDGIYFERRSNVEGANVTAWMSEATEACREIWPEAIIMSEFSAPTGTGAVDWADGFSKNAHHDHYFVRTYDLGSAARYLTYEGLVGAAEPGIVGEAWKQYGNQVVPDQFVISKPYREDEAHEGFVDHRGLSRILCQASKKIGYAGGIMFPSITFGQDLGDVQMLRYPCKLLKSAKKRSILLAEPPMVLATSSETLSTEPMVDGGRDRSTTALETTDMTEFSTSTETQTLTTTTATEEPSTSTTTTGTTTAATVGSDSTVSEALTTAIYATTTELLTSTDSDDKIVTTRTDSTGSIITVPTAITASTILTYSATSAVTDAVTTSPTVASSEGQTNKPEHTVTTALSTAAVSEVEKCKTLVKGGPGMSHYNEVCKNACVDYDAVKGILEPWCPNGYTAEAIAQCVLQQRPYCELV